MRLVSARETRLLADKLTELKVESRSSVSYMYTLS